MLDCPITINKGDEMNKTWLIKKHDYIVAKIDAPKKVYAVVLAWEKIFNISNAEDLMNKFGADKIFLYADSKLNSNGYYLDKQIGGGQ